ncbi:aquaporin, putative [Plasmodium sp. gorilla clade G2]|uniref:aquaporin, putative n=1 Tax=Plasmodium sp. gorilla clade G2 TaxID=880535 RepID=UPI000D207E2E|nr:aquaporin, putative [Plasmodium sp. gorilla clade G2]SOV13533.1 aquaporin, putative [Plasmodium sp. gorilla clade G2]
MKIQKGLFLQRCIKNVLRKIIKFIKGYVKDIIKEINVKSFKKYKYNLFFEFIGSFLFVFFISIYMLNSNSNEEYIIKHTKQINPYQTNDILIPGYNNFEGEINNIKYMNNLEQEGKHVVENILLEKDNNEYKGNEQNKKEMERNDDKIKNNSQNEYQKDDEKNKNNNNNNDNINEKEVNTISDEKIKDMEDTKNISNKNENDHNTNKELKNEKINNKENDEKNIKNEDDINNKENMIKSVDKIIFKEPVNEYSKIKIEDINNINLKDIDEYEVLKNSQNKKTSNHAIYSFVGCFIYVIFILLGAHINPAYTYALWLTEPKKYGFALSTLYVTFQYFGGIVASIICAHLYGSIFIYTLLPKKEIMKTFLCEFISTFLITLLLLSLYNYKKKFMEENKNDESLTFNINKLRNMSSLYNFNTYEDFYSYDMFNTNHNKKYNSLLYIDNKYIKYIMNHIFYLLFIFFSLLFFVFVTNTTLNPMFSTSTLYTYLYYKIFKASNSFKIYSIFISFLSITKIFQLLIFYIQSLPLWIGPYFGSAFAASFLALFKENEEEIVNIIDTNVYSSYNKKKEQIPLIDKNSAKQNAYLIEYNDNIHYNSYNYLLPSVF